MILITTRKHGVEVWLLVGDSIRSFLSFAGAITAAILTSR